MGDLPIGLLPDLRPCGRKMCVGICLVVELIREHGVGRFVRDPLRGHYVTVGMVRRHGSWRDDHLGTECFQEANFFLRHLVRHREDAVVALERRGDGKRDPRIAACPFDDGSSRLQ